MQHVFRNGDVRTAIESFIMKDITSSTQRFVVAQTSIHAKHVEMSIKVGEVYMHTTGNSMQMM